MKTLLALAIVFLPASDVKERELEIECGASVCQLPKEQLAWIIAHNNAATMKVIEQEKELAKLRRVCKPMDA